jgi:hypothetical protein
MQVVYFKGIYDSTKFQDAALSGTVVSPTPEVFMAPHVGIIEGEKLKCAKVRDTVNFPWFPC